MLTPEQIRLLRKALGLNTTQFATRLGVTENAVRKWELGERHPRYAYLVLMNEMVKEAALNGFSLSVAS